MDNLIINKLLPLVSIKGRDVIMLSHNTLDFVKELNRPCINAFFSILYSISKNMKRGDMWDGRVYGEQQIEIPKEYITKAHRGVDETLLPLLNIVITFSRKIPGYSCCGITRLISGIKYENGHVIVSVPGDTIPWLIYCGKGVGYFWGEMHVCLTLSARPQKLLYVFLMSKIDNALCRCIVSVSVEDLVYILDVKPTRSIGQIMQKYLKQFGDNIEKAGSQYRISFESVKQTGYTGKKGRLPISKIVFTIENVRIIEKKAQGKELEDVIDMLVKLINKYRPNSSIIGVTRLIQAIETTGRTAEFLYKMEKISKRNEKNENYHKLVNTAVKILRDDFGIAVFC